MTPTGDTLAGKDRRRRRAGFSPSSAPIPSSGRSCPAAEQAVHLNDLAAALFPEPASGPVTGGEDERITFLTHLVAALSHVRVVAGRAALSVDLHLWVRELTRLDRVASSTARYLWSDDGELASLAGVRGR